MNERWHVIAPREDKMAAITETEDGSSGALAYVGREGRDKMADARLIADAPEMLWLLNEAFGLIEGSGLEDFGPEPTWSSRANDLLRHHLDKGHGDEVSEDPLGGSYDEYKARAEEIRRKYGLDK